MITSVLDGDWAGTATYLTLDNRIALEEKVYVRSDTWSEILIVIVVVVGRLESRIAPL